MSPLARSLLALAALFATAATQQDFPPDNCVEALIGRETDDARHLTPEVVPNGYIDDLCSKNGQILGVELVGVLVEACNNDPYGAAPIIITGKRLVEVEVRCVGDCRDGLTVAFTEYCRPVIPLPPPRSRHY